MPVFLFPGQGAQFPGMGIDLFDGDPHDEAGIRTLFDRASAVWGSDIKGLLGSDAETLKRTDASQIAITVASLAAAKALARRGVTPTACAGFSLGEYPALCLSGVLTEEETLRLVFERGRIMQEAVDAIASGEAMASTYGNASADAIPGSAADAPTMSAPAMSAVLGLSPERVDEVLESFGSASVRSVWGANYNSPVQTVISGTGESLAKAEEALKAAGARRCLRLKVAGPFHSPLMAEAGKQFAAVLESVAFRDPVLPLFSNVTGSRVSSGAEAKKNAVLHISSPVRWTAEEAAIASLIEHRTGASSDGSPDLVECGPGKVLTGLWTDSKQAGTCVPWGDLLAALTH